MRKINKMLAIAGVTAGVATAGFIGVGAASAATTSSTSTNSVSSLVSAIAKKFNLKTSDVQAVFDEQRTAMEASRESELTAKQAQLVKDGKLTQAQSDAITAKRATLKAERAAARTSASSKTEAERKTAREAEQTALNTWLKEQGISTDYAYLLMGGRGGHGRSGSTTTSSSTTAS